MCVAFCEWWDKLLENIPAHEMETCQEKYGWDCRTCPYFGDTIKGDTIKSED